MVGWLGGSARTLLSGFVLAGGSPIIFGCTVFCFSLLCRPALGKFEYESMHLFAAVRNAVLL